MEAEELHKVAREAAEEYEDLDKKQLRFNDIVETAIKFYNNPEDGVRELVDACSKQSPLYVKKRPMWEILNKEYLWYCDN